MRLCWLGIKNEAGSRYDDIFKIISLETIGIDMPRQWACPVGHKAINNDELIREGIIPSIDSTWALQTHRATFLTIPARQFIY
jgi:hypothetical protein